MDQNGRPLKTDDKVNFTLLINSNDTLHYRSNVKGHGFLSFAKNLSQKYRKQLLKTAPETGLDPLKTASKKTTGEFIGNKIADKLVKPKPVSDENSADVEGTSTREKTKILNKLK